MNITEFLEARISDDEAEAGESRRRLAECEAKRAIISAHKNQEDNDDDGAWIVASEVLLKALASVYEDHQDYRQEWAK